MESSTNTQLLSAGTKCAHPHCGLHDYLPFKCQYCKESFCSDHFRPSAHQCEKQVSNDRIAPPCPLCQTPVAIPPGEDPDSAMDRHFNSTCVVMGNKKKSSTPRCSKAHCEKVLYAPIVCESCKKQFCAAHRHWSSHKCVVTSTSSSSPPQAPQASTKIPLKPFAAINSQISSLKKSSSSSSPSSNARNVGWPSVKSSSAKAPAQAPVMASKSSKPSSSSKTEASPSSSSSTSNAAAGSSSSTSQIHNPFSKTDRLVLMKPSSSPPSSVTLPTTKITSSSSPPPSSSPSRIPSTPPSPQERSSMRAVQEDIMSKPKPHIEVTSFAPPPIFGTA